MKRRLVPMLFLIALTTAMLSLVLGWHWHLSVASDAAVSLVAEWQGVAGRVSWAANGEWVLIEQIAPDETRVLRYDPSDPLVRPCEWQGNLNPYARHASGSVLTYQDAAISLWNIETCERLAERIPTSPPELNTNYPWFTKWLFAPSGNCAVAHNAMHYSDTLTSTRLHVFGYPDPPDGFCGSTMWRGYLARDIVITDDYMLWIDEGWSPNAMLPLTEETQLQAMLLSDTSSGIELGEHCASGECRPVGQSASAMALSPNENRIAVGTLSGHVQFYSWNSDTLTFLSEIDSNIGYAVQDLQFSGNGEVMAIRGVKWDVEKSRYFYDFTLLKVEPMQIIRHFDDASLEINGEVLAFALNSTGDLLAVSYVDPNSGARVEIIDPKTTSALHIFDGSLQFAWSPTAAETIATVDYDRNTTTIWAIRPEQ